MGFLSALEELEQWCGQPPLPTSQLAANLAEAEMLVYVHAFNQPSWAEELELLLGREDKLYWVGRELTCPGLPLSTLVTHMPLSEQDKLELYKTLMSCVVDILADRCDI